MFYPLEDTSAGLPRQVLELAARTGRSEIEGWRVRKDGRRYRAHVIVSALRDEENRLVGFSKLVRDLTPAGQAPRSSPPPIRLRPVDDHRSRAAAFADRTSRLQDLTTAFAEALTPEQIRKVVVERVLPAFGALQSPGANRATDDRALPPGIGRG